MSRKKRKKVDFSRDFPSSEFKDFIQEEVKKQISEILGTDQKKSPDYIPLSVFDTELTTFESLVKYLREEFGYTYSKIAEILGRKKTTISTTYIRAKSKLSTTIKPITSVYSVPLSSFNQSLSILEVIVKHLKEKYHLSNHKIATLLNRDDRTIWTVYSRVKKKT